MFGVWLCFPLLFDFLVFLWCLCFTQFNHSCLSDWIVIVCLLCFSLVAFVFILGATWPLPQSPSEWLVCVCVFALSLVAFGLCLCVCLVAFVFIVRATWPLPQSPSEWLAAHSLRGWLGIWELREEDISHSVFILNHKLPTKQIIFENFCQIENLHCTGCNWEAWEGKGGHLSFDPAENNSYSFGHCFVQHYVCDNVECFSFINFTPKDLRTWPSPRATGEWLAGCERMTWNMKRRSSRRSGGHSHYLKPLC